MPLVAALAKAYEAKIPNLKVELGKDKTVLAPPSLPQQEAESGHGPHSQALARLGDSAWGLPQPESVFAAILHPGPDLPTLHCRRGRGPWPGRA